MARPRRCDMQRLASALPVPLFAFRHACARTKLHAGGRRQHVRLRPAGPDKRGPRPCTARPRWRRDDVLERVARSGARHQFDAVRAYRRFGAMDDTVLKSPIISGAWSVARQRRRNVWNTSFADHVRDTNSKNSKMGIDWLCRHVGTHDWRYGGRSMGAYIVLIGFLAARALPA
jgi:hypothetical protein